MEHKILIKKKYLIFREDAKKLAQEIKKGNFLKNLIDFSEVVFMSRSFIDELLNQLKKFREKEIEIKFLNLNPLLSKFIFKVEKTKRKIQEALSKE